MFDVVLLLFLLLLVFGLLLFVVVELVGFMGRVAAAMKATVASTAFSFSFSFLDFELNFIIVFVLMFFLLRICVKSFVVYVLIKMEIIMMVMVLNTSAFCVWFLTDDSSNIAVSKIEFKYVLMNVVFEFLMKCVVKNFLNLRGVSLYMY